MKRRHLLPLLFSPISLPMAFATEPAVIDSQTLARKWRRTKSLVDPVVEVRKTTRKVRKGITLEEEEVAVSVDADTETRFENILFALDSDRLEGDVTKAQLQEIAKAMQAAGDETFLIEGHTCDLGSAEHNKELSQRRAEAVAMALETLGINRKRLDAVGFGEEKRLTTATDEAARAQNRRVQIYRKV
ncbi:MAG: OmpA family protein [Verrucomicrobiales bacterium]|nr:OmpA family protein [Verrucomicrobiales bacterium]MCP5557978.1 OmpA family protein [Verrucomicrobiaceae bacterium]